MANPKIVIEFGGPTDVTFRVDFSNNPTEGQFQVAGEELFTIGRILREARVREQLKPKLVTGSAPAVAAPAPVPVPAGVAA